MGCCDKNTSVNQIYQSITDRLKEFAINNTGPELLKKFPTTKVYLFTFLDIGTMCTECKEKLAAMHSWVTKYNLLEDPVNNMKWILEDEMKKNLIVDDMGITKSPTHIICDGNCRILDIVTGYPSPDWMEKHFLQFIRG